jgi:hypothetical protein
MWRQLKSAWDRAEIEERLFLTKLRNEPKERRRRALDAIKKEARECEEMEDKIRRLDGRCAVEVWVFSSRVAAVRLQVLE